MEDDIDAVVILHQKIDEVAADYSISVDVATTFIVLLRNAAEHLEQRYIP